MSQYVVTAGAAPNATAELAIVLSARSAMYANAGVKLVCMELVEYVQAPNGVAWSSIVGADSANAGVSVRRLYGEGGNVKAVTTFGVVPTNRIIREPQYPHVSTV